MSRARLLQLVWGTDFVPDSRALDVFIAYLRRKLGEAGAPSLVRTVRGVGFVLERPPHT
jgi:two-component system response regulator PrrA